MAEPHKANPLFMVVIGPTLSPQTGMIFRQSFQTLQMAVFIEPGFWTYSDPCSGGIHEAMRRCAKY